MCKLLFKSSAFVALLSFMLVSGESSAIDLKPNEIRAKTVEKPVAVLQKRFFQKAWRPELGLLSGGFLNEAYTNTEKRGARLSLFFTEWFGLELQYTDTSVSSSQDKLALDQLKFKKANPGKDEDPDKLVTPKPEVNKIHEIIDLNLISAPFYGKMNLLDWFIVYMDTYMVAGASQLKTDQGNKMALSLGIGQRYYLFKSFSIRIDFHNHNFSETRSNKTSRRNQQSWDLGMSWFFL